MFTTYQLVHVLDRPVTYNADAWLGAAVRKDGVVFPWTWELLPCHLIDPHRTPTTFIHFNEALSDVSEILLMI